MYSGYCGHVASGRGYTTAAQALAAPAELAHSSIQGSEAGAGILRVSVGAQAHLRCRPTQRVTPLPFPPSGNGPAHRKWLSTISFLAFLGSPVTNRVLLTCQRNTPVRKITRASQSAGGHPVQSVHPVFLPKENNGGSGA